MSFTLHSEQPGNFKSNSFNFSSYTLSSSSSSSSALLSYSTLLCFWFSSLSFKCSSLVEMPFSLFQALLRVVAKLNSLFLSPCRSNILNRFFDDKQLCLLHFSLQSTVFLRVVFCNSVSLFQWLIGPLAATNL